MQDKQAAYLRCIHDALPDLVIHTARLRASEGQFNDIVIINELLVFRFPRTPQGAATLTHEIALLAALQGRTTLPIPDPLCSSTNAEHPFMGYRMLSGAPLWNETLAAIGDETVIERIADQLATFLRALHATPPTSLNLELPVQDGRKSTSALYTAFRDQLFPYMRPDARSWITEHFERFLSEPRHFAYRPTLHHGDFGTGNILYDAQSRTLSGVIDWSFAGIADPALDIASIAGCGRAFAPLEYTFPQLPHDHNTISPSEEVWLARLFRRYPEAEAMRERARFYKGTYALYQALTALRDGDKALFEDGMAAYV